MIESNSTKNQLCPSNTKIRRKNNQIKKRNIANIIFFNAHAIKKYTHDPHDRWSNIRQTCVIIVNPNESFINKVKLLITKTILCSFSNQLHDPSILRSFDPFRRSWSLILFVNYKRNLFFSTCSVLLYSISSIRINSPTTESFDTPVKYHYKPSIHPTSQPTIHPSSNPIKMLQWRTNWIKKTQKKQPSVCAYMYCVHTCSYGWIQKNYNNNSSHKERIRRRYDDENDEEKNEPFVTYTVLLLLI